MTERAKASTTQPPTPQPPTPQPPTPQPQAQRFDPVRSATRLAAGGVLRGAAGISSRLRRWEQLAETVPPTARGEPPGARPDRALTACRHALIGLTVESERWLNDRAASLASGGLRPRPPRNPIPVAAWKAGVTELIKTGRNEEERAVALARIAVDDLFGSSVPALVKRSVATAAGWMASSPAVREMVTTPTEEAVSRLRDDSVQADAHVERRVRSVLRRSPVESEPG